jgi:hypothetical protein
LSRTNIPSVNLVVLYVHDNRGPRCAFSCVDVSLRFAHATRSFLQCRRLPSGDSADVPRCTSSRFIISLSKSFNKFSLCFQNLLRRNVTKSRKNTDGGIGFADSRTQTSPRMCWHVWIPADPAPPAT